MEPLKHTFIRSASIACFPTSIGTPTIQAMLEHDAQSENQARAERIRAAIRLIPHSKKDIAEMLGVTQQAITGWETTGRIGKKSLSGLAKLSGRSAEYFISGGAGAAQTEAPASLASELEALHAALWAMSVVMVKHRPAEAAELAARLGQLPEEQQSSAVLHGLIQTLRQSARQQ